MLEVDAIACGDRIRVAGFVGGAGHDLALPLHVGAELLHVRFSEDCEVARRRRRGVHQHEVRHVCRMPKRVLQREHGTPGMPQECGRFDFVVLSDPVEIVDVRRHRHVVRLHMFGGSAASALVVVNEAIPVSQSIELGKKVGLIEIRTAVELDDRLTVPDLSGVE